MSKCQFSDKKQYKLINFDYILIFIDNNIFKLQYIHYS